MLKKNLLNYLKSLYTLLPLLLSLTLSLCILYLWMIALWAWASSFVIWEVSRQSFKILSSSDTLVSLPSPSPYGLLYLLKVYYPNLITILPFPFLFWKVSRMYLTIACTVIKFAKILRKFWVFCYFLMSPLIISIYHWSPKFPPVTSVLEWCRGKCVLTEKMWDGAGELLSSNWASDSSKRAANLRVT
jgi:hypothetical protein